MASLADFTRMLARLVLDVSPYDVEGVRWTSETIKTFLVDVGGLKYVSKAIETFPGDIGECECVSNAFPGDLEGLRAWLHGEFQPGYAGEGGGRGTGKLTIGRWVHKLCRSPALFKRSRASYSAPTSAKSWNVNLFSAEVYFLLPWPSGLVIRKLGRGSNGSAPRPRGDCLEGEREELSFFPSFHARLPNSILLWSLHGSEWVWPFLC